MPKSKRKTILIILSLLLALIPVILPATTHARGLVPCGGYLDNGQPEPPCTVEYAFILIARITNWLIGMAGVYAVFQIVNAGFWLIPSMGNEESITKWRKALSNAIVGFALVMMAYMFMNTAVNLLLAQEKEGYMVNFSDPVCYITNGQDCLKKK